MLSAKKKLSSIKHDLNFRARSDGVVTGIMKQTQALIEHESDIHGEGVKYTRKGKKNGGIHKKGEGEVGTRGKEELPKSTEAYAL